MAAKGRLKANGSAKGLLALKFKGTFTDTWADLVCEFIPETRILFYDDGKNVVSKTVDRGIPIEPKAGRKPNRFDVMCTSGELLSFSAPTLSDRELWMKVSLC